MQVVKNVESDVRFDALVDGIGSNGVRNLIVYPVLMRQKVVAVVVVANKLSATGRVAGDDFTPSDVSAVQDFATLATLAFLQKQVNKTRANAARRRAGEAKSGDRQNLEDRENESDEGSDEEAWSSVLDKAALESDDSDYDSEREGADGANN